MADVRTKMLTTDCRFCRNGTTVNPKFCGQDPKCQYCYGTGKICLERCRCGRPIRLDAKGKITELVYCCGRKECRVACAPEEVRAQVIALNRNDLDDDTEAAMFYGC